MNMCGRSKSSNVLQRFAKTKWFIAVYSLLGTVQSASTTYFAVTLTTIEKRFKIPSQTTGIILCGNEVSQIILSLLLTYFGGQKHIPKWMSWGVVSSAVSCFILAWPHFIYGAGEDALHYTEEYQSIYQNVTTQLKSSPTKAKDNKLCRSSSITDENVDYLIEDYTHIPLILIFLSQFALGIGNTLYYSLGPTYIDDNSKHHKTPLMLSYAYAMRILGPIFGYIFAYIFLRIYIDPTLTPVIGKDDPRFLGAWWLGFLVLGALMFIFAFLIRIFPKRIALKEQIVEDDTKNEAAIIIVEEKQNAEMKDFPKAIWRLLTNKMLMLNTIETVFWCLSYSSLSFIGRIMEVQFNRTSAGGSIFTGPLTMFGMAVGMLLSGFVITKYKPSANLLFFWNIIIGIIFICSTFYSTQLGCESTNSISINEPILSCNTNCLCSDISYNPVCDHSTATTYFSPCHAGCTSFDEKLNIYANCSCNVGAMMTVNRTATPNACVSECNFEYYAYSLISMVTSFIGLFGMMGNILLNFRAVEQRDKALAQGFSLFTTSLFALIPGPIIFGRIIDSTCLVWNNKNGRKGNCLLYDPIKFRYYIHSASGIFIIIGVIFDILIWWYGRNMDLYGEDSNTEKHVQNGEKKAQQSD